jgi:hypothetical protein
MYFSLHNTINPKHIQYLIEVILVRIQIMVGVCN